MSDPYVITRLCQDCVDGACVEVCPMDCIYAPTPDDADPAHNSLPDQLFIDPDACIFCGACEPACPWGAIYEESAVPEAFAPDVALNRLTVDSPERFEVARPTPHRDPTPEAITANRRKHGLEK